jgi:hypothetical protein
MIETHDQEICSLEAEIERLAAELHGTVTTKYHDDLMHQWHVQVVELQARVEALEKVQIAVLKHRDNKKFLNIDTWNACVYAAEAAGE